MRGMQQPALHVPLVTGEVVVASRYRFQRDSMLILFVLAATRLAHKQMVATFRLAVPVINSVV